MTTAQGMPEGPFEVSGDTILYQDRPYFVWNRENNQRFSREDDLKLRAYWANTGYEQAMKDMAAKKDGHAA